MVLSVWYAAAKLGDVPANFRRNSVRLGDAPAKLGEAPKPPGGMRVELGEARKGDVVFSS
eukprot:8414437-Alexandrium_andersonii.AAC.1